MKLSSLLSEEILTEMPKTIPTLKWHDLFNHHLNHLLYENFIAQQDKKIYLKVNDHATIYQFKNEFVCLDTKIQEITYFMKYKTSTNETLGNFIWQSMVWRSKTSNYISGIPKKIFFEFFIPKFGCIVTDSDQSWDGERFWGARIGDALEEHLNVYYFNFMTKELIQVKNIQEFQKIEDEHDIWGPSDLHRLKRMVISDRELPI